MSFINKLEAAITRNNSLLVVGLDPNPEMVPARACFTNKGSHSSQYMSGLQDWLLYVVEQTHSHVCAYKPTLGFYQALGSAGFELLEAVLQAIPDTIPVILDAKHADLNTSSVVAQTVFDQWNVDAITLNPYSGQDIAAPFLMYLEKAVLMTCCTSNPSASNIQNYPGLENPLYLAIAREARTWGTPTQLGLEVGTTDSTVLADVRAIAPERLILARSIWQESVDLAQMLMAGLNTDGSGLLVPMPQDWLGHADIGDKVRSLQKDINQVRSQRMQDSASCDRV